MLVSVILQQPKKRGRPTLRIDGKPMSAKERKRRSRAILKRKSMQMDLFTNPLGAASAAPLPRG